MTWKSACTIPVSSTELLGSFREDTLQYSQMATKFTSFICPFPDSQLDLRSARLRGAAALQGTTISDTSCPKPELVSAFELDFSQPHMSSINQE